MGLDGVEIVMRTEERFGITISNSEAERVRTPGMLIDLVRSKLTETSERYCRSQRAFYLLRKVLTKDLSIPRSAILPDSELRNFAASHAQAGFWKALQAGTAARSWPALDLPKDLRIFKHSTMLFLFLAIPSAGIHLWPTAGSAAASIVVALFVAGWFGNNLQKHLQPFCRYIPARITTLADLVPFAETSASIEWTRADIACAVREIVVEQLSFDPKAYREDADFIRDLGLN